MQNNKMAEMPVKKLMLSMGVPIIISMMLQAFYNIVDSAFVSNMSEGGEAALNALTLAFPMQVLMIAVSIGTGVGVNVRTAKCLGMGDSERAGLTAGNGLTLALIISAAFLLFGLFGAGPYIRSQTSNAQAAAMGTDYLRICCVFSFGVPFFGVLEKLLQASGHSGCSTVAQISGAVTNIALDPVLIYGLFGLPELGARGAAYATVIGQAVSFVVALCFHFKVNTFIPRGLKYLRLDAATVKQIYSIGLPAVISQALISAMTYGMNIVLGRTGDEAVTAYGLYYKIWQFLLFAAFGMRDAIMPITAFAFGMGSRERIRQTVRWGQLYTLIIMLAGTLGLEALARPLCSVFGLSGDTDRLCLSAIHIISLCFVFAGVNIAFQGVFQALGAGISSLVVSVCRQALFVFPSALLLSWAAGWSPDKIGLVWWTFPITELLTCGVSVLLYRSVKKRTSALLAG
ncbi:MAG: MATE family efflux transporter [Ruminococcus sp.]|nr:MATE family efflux transporter [Ruminococcus sp.]